jgi:hypothetical protein
MFLFSYPLGATPNVDSRGWMVMTDLGRIADY